MSWLWVSKTGGFSVDLQFDGSATFDIAHDARLYKFGVRFEPSFYFGNGMGLFHGWVPLGERFLLARSDLALVAGHHIIEDAGTNPDLAGIETYAGVGYDFTVQVAFNTLNPLLSKWVGKYTHTYRYNTGSAPDIWRNVVGVSYVLNDNMTLDFDYTNGRDVNTLQQEEKWTGALTFRN